MKFFHIYLTEKLTSSSFKEKNLPGMTMQTSDGKARYANYFHIKGKDISPLVILFLISSIPFKTLKEDVGILLF